MMDKKSVQEPEIYDDYWCKLISKNETLSNTFITKDLFTIGRAPTNDLQILNGKISGIHCTIFKTHIGSNTEFFIEDNSSNGTYLNEKKLERGIKAVLRNGDEVVLLKHENGYSFFNS